MGRVDSGEINKPALERQWATQAARKGLNRDDRALWESSRYTVRPYVYFDKVLIAWTVVKGQPQIKEIFKVIGLDVSFQDGLQVRLYAEVAKTETLITHTPHRLLPNLDVFGWVPYFNEVRYASGNWDDPLSKKNLRLCVCLKMLDRGADRVPEGQHVLSELHVFREQWPQYADTRF